MTNFRIFLASSAVLLFAGAAEAAIGPAGCGLGNIVFGKDNQILAATTNGSSGSQTFGITSGTSNCVSGGDVAQMMHFIDTNKIALSKEAARGEGETIEVLAQFVGCQDAQTLGSSMKNNYQTLFPSMDVSPAHVTGELQRMLKSDVKLSATCAPIG